MNKKIKDIKNNDEIEILALVNKRLVGVSSNGKKYLSLELVDNTASLDAKLWDADNYLEELKTGQIYKFHGFVSLFKNNLQLKIVNVTKIQEDKINWSDFIKEAPIDSEKEYDFIIKIINQMQNKTYNKIMLEILKKHGAKFKMWPAATKFHHNIRKGLLWHTVSMLKLAKNLPNVYPMYKTINYDLLYSGIILHDLGKIIELDIDGGVYKYTTRGKLVGHISIMNSELNYFAKQLNLENNDTVLLEHLILASHGKMEFGSPVLPKLMESEILYLLDNLDARIFSINQELNNIEVNNFTARINSLEQRSFYHHYKK